MSVCVCTVPQEEDQALKDLGAQLKDVSFTAARAVSRLVEMQTMSYQVKLLCLGSLLLDRCNPNYAP